MRKKEAGQAVVEGARLRYEVVGEGEPLVFVHAGIADMRMWDPRVGAFAERHRVIRYDMRGFGGSPAARAPTPATRTCGGCWTSLVFGARPSWAVPLGARR